MLFSMYEKVKKFNDYSQMNYYLDILESLRSQIDDAIIESQIFNKREQLLKLSLTENQDLNLLAMNFKPFYRIWYLVNQFESELIDYLNGPLIKLNYAQIDKKIKNYNFEIG